MKNYNKKDYYQAAFLYWQHHDVEPSLLSDDETEITILDSRFTKREVYLMMENYIWQYADKKEVKLFKKISKIHEYPYYKQVMRTQGMSLEKAKKYLDSRKIKKGNLKNLLKRLESYQELIPEEYAYVQKVIAYYDSLEMSPEEIEKKAQEKEMQRRLEAQEAEQFIEYYLSDSNPIPVYLLYCEYMGVRNKDMVHKVKLLAHYNPELYQRFQEANANESTKENVQRLLTFIDPILNKMALIVADHQREGSKPDLIDYYEITSFPFMLLSKIVSRYYTKKETDIIVQFHNNQVMNREVTRYISKQIEINGVVFTKEDQYRVISWLHEKNYPVTYDIFMDKLKRMAREKNKQKHL